MVVRKRTIQSGNRSLHIYVAIKRWLDGCIDKQISQVYLLGGDVLMYKDLNEIWGMLEQKSMSIQLYYRYDLFTENHKKLLNATIGQLTFVVPMWKFDEELFSSLSGRRHRTE